MASLASINIRFTVNLTEFKAAMADATKQLKKVGEELQSLGGVLAMGVTLPLMALGAKLLKSAADTETLAVSFEGLTGSIGRAKKITEELIRFSSKTPFRIDGITESAKRLLNFGVAQDDVVPKLKMLGDIAAGVGIPLNNMATIFTKIKTKGKAMSVDLVSMSNKGIPIVKVLADQFGVSEKAVLKLAKQGKISFNDIETAMKGMAGEGGRYNNMMSKQANTFNGILTSFRDAIDLVTSDIGESLMNAFDVKGKMLAFKDWIEKMTVRFNNLSPAIQKIIFSIGVFAASLGPLIVIFGTFLTMLPQMVVGLEMVTKTFSAFAARVTAFVMANPFGAIALAVTALLAVLFMYNRQANETVNKARLLWEVNQAAAKSIAKERAELDTLIKVAKDETKSKEDRLAAIKKINQISPEYLGNINLENINTNNVTEAIENYIAKLNEKAKAQAIMAKKQELFNKLIEKEQEKLGEKGTGQSIFDYLAEDVLGFEQKIIKNKEELEAYIKTLGLTGKAAEGIRRAYNPYLEQKEKDIKAINDQITALDEYGKTLDGVGAIVVNTDFDDDGAKAGTIKFYNEKIAALKKYQQEVTTTLGGFLKAEYEILEFQKKIDEISNKRTPVKAVTIKDDKKKVEKSALIERFEAEISKMKELQKNVSDTSEVWKSYQSIIDGLQTRIDLIVDPSSVIKAGKSFDEFVSSSKINFKALQEAAKEFNEGFDAIMLDTTSSFIEGFGELIGNATSGGASLSDIFNLMLSTIADMAIQLGKLAIGIGLAVEGIKKALSSLAGPVAIAAGVALIALGTFAKSAIANIGGKGATAFANGGVVYGPTMGLVGEYPGARSNPEVIAPLNKLKSLIEPAGGGDITVGLDGSFRINGSDLELVLSRTQAKKNRTS